ncbi:hypothetical protein G6O69_12855 [Pseudenhygromyxa sp. WMMC2535]|uniref:hypothetical protein n=1 Tax=Pseudenhygromyxa sp. WMMC2535 TaxID=2712867 RepID=UPI0015516DF4|nr:hypothetical protein [Pseudenhygromyxa sp. WMMC2535]NVB38722.1 hypothetical protein [Pseudenhygromyxa sp. WMMC2535]
MNGRGLVVFTALLSLSACTAPKKDREAHEADAEAPVPEVEPAVEPESEAPAPEQPEQPEQPEPGPALLAQIFGAPEHALHAGDLNSAAVIEAALPDFELRPRRRHGSFIHRGSVKVAVVMTEIGEPFEALTLLGPGLADPRGVEVGTIFDTVADFSGLICDVEGGEDYTGIWVACRVEGPAQSRYIFALKTDEALDEDIGVARARELVGETRLRAIEIDAR